MSRTVSPRTPLQTSKARLTAEKAFQDLPRGKKTAKKSWSGKGEELKNCTDCLQNWASPPAERGEEKNSREEGGGGEVHS